MSATNTAMLGVVGAGAHIVLGLAGTVLVAARVAVAVGVGLAAGLGFLVLAPVVDLDIVFGDLVACVVVLVAAAVAAVLGVAAVVAPAVVDG